MTSEASKTCIVIGAGLAGLASALGILRLPDWRVIVFEEQGAAERSAKGWLVLFCNGQRALRMGLDVDLDQLPDKTTISQLGIGSARVPAGSPGQPAFGLKLASLLELLTRLVLDRGGEIRFQQRVREVGREGDKAFAVLGDGTRTPADLLIGADGVHSIVRSYLNPNKDCLRKLDQLNVRGYSMMTPSTPLPSPGVLYFPSGQRLAFGCTVKAETNEIWFIANWQPTDEPLDDLRARLRALCGDDAELSLAKELFASDKTTLTGPWQFYDVPHVPKWHDKGAIVLVGCVDELLSHMYSFKIRLSSSAVHATASNTGAGASFAAEDAVVLARCIAAKPTLGESLEFYESKRRSRCEAFVKQGARFAIFKPTSPARAWLKKTLVPILFRIVTLFVSPAGWVYDYRADEA